MKNIEKGTILIIDDEPKIVDVLTSFLQSKEFNVLSAEDGEKGLELFRKNPVSLILLDLMLPGISGESLCMTIRKTSRIPIIMLTAKIQESEVINGFDYGADDYITKPFSLKELHARIEAVLRRSQNGLFPLYQKNVFGEGDLTVDFDNRMVKKKQTIVLLTPNEYKLFIALVKYPNKIFTREELIHIALGEEFEGYDRAIDSHIKNIRQKIETDPKNPIYIVTVHGIGYKFGGE
jgi:DNA-binding response OmpR family regulator